MTHISINGLDYACPFLDLVRRHTPREYANLERSILDEEDLLQPIQIYTSEKWGFCILDGHTRAKICNDNGIEMDPWNRGRMSDAAARKRSLRLNRDRRHLTPAEQIEAAEERRPQTRTKQAEGKTTRVIAEELGVSQTTVINDLADSVEQGCSTESDDVAAETVTGSDGKEYQAKKPKKRPKRRQTIPDRMAAHFQELAKLLKRYTAGKANASNRARVGVMYPQAGFTLTEDGTRCLEYGKGYALHRELAPSVR